MDASVHPAVVFFILLFLILEPLSPTKHEDSVQYQASPIYNKTPSLQNTRAPLTPTPSSYHKKKPPTSQPHTKILRSLKKTPPSLPTYLPPPNPYLLSHPLITTTTTTTTTTKPSHPQKCHPPQKPRCTFPDCKAAPQRIVGDCTLCGGHFCSKHRVLKNHQCSGLESCRKELHEKNAEKLNAERTVVVKG